MALSLIATIRANAQDSNAIHPIALLTTGIAIPIGTAEGLRSAAPTVYMGLAFHRGRSRTSFEIGQSFTTFSQGADHRSTLSVTAITVRRILPITTNVETYLSAGLGQSWATGSTFHFGVATLAGTGLRIGGRVAVVLTADYMGVIHGPVLQVIPIQIGVNVR